MRILVADPGFGYGVDWDFQNNIFVARFLNTAIFLMFHQREIYPPNTVTGTFQRI